MGLETHDYYLIAGLAVPISAVLGLTLATARKDAKLAPARWLSPNPSRAWAEVFYLRYSLVWITWFFFGVVLPQSYEGWAHVEYMLVTAAMAVPCVLGPLLLAPAVDAGTPFWRRSWVKTNVWIAIFSYVGNYFWTHYLFNMVGASYTFASWRINDVPISMFLATHAYFCTYFSASTAVLRRWRTSATFAGTPAWLRPLATTAIVVLMSVFTALAESVTISSFPYYHIRDRAYMYSVGSIVYGIYFVFGFPMFARMDECDAGGRDPLRLGGGDGDEVAAAAKKGGKAAAGAGGGACAGGQGWTLWETAVDALAASMLVTIALDLFKEGYRAAVDARPGAVPWLPILTA